MATALTVSTVARAGIVLSTLGTSADGAGNNFLNTGNEFLYIKNASVGTITVTLVNQLTIDGAAVTAKTVAILTLTEVLIGPFPTEIYNDANGKMNVTWSGVTSTTVLACKLLPKV